MECVKIAIALNSNLIDIDNRVKLNEVYNIGVEEAIGTLGDKTVYRLRLFSKNVTISESVIISTIINSKTVDTLIKMDCNILYADMWFPAYWLLTSPNVYLGSRLTTVGVEIYGRNTTAKGYSIEIVYTKA